MKMINREFNLNCNEEDRIFLILMDLTEGIATFYPNGDLEIEHNSNIVSSTQMENALKLAKVRSQSVYYSKVFNVIRFFSIDD